MFTGTELLVARGELRAQEFSQTHQRRRFPSVNRTMYSTSASPLSSALMAASGWPYGSTGVNVMYPVAKDM
jgi:hypothetical protein